jgi:hypothetical protein
MNETRRTWSDALGRIQTAVMLQVERDKLSPLGTTLPVPYLTSLLISELMACSVETGSGDGDRVDRMLAIPMPWEDMTILEYLRTMLRTPGVRDVGQLVAVINRQLTVLQKTHLQRKLESWATNVLYQPPRVNIPFYNLVSAIHNQKYEDGDGDLLFDNDDNESETDQIE